MEKINRSLDYGALDHKWLARKELSGCNMTLKEFREKEEDDVSLQLLKIATSSFNYYYKNYNVIKSDRSLRAITELCTDKLLAFDIKAEDDEVFHLSNVFNLIINSNRGLLKCYDCGTNARAAFLKLITAARGSPVLTHSEQQRMKRQYLVNIKTPVDEIKKCKSKMLDCKVDTVFIMSISVQGFGHVWVIEKRFFNGVPRYHHYQSSLNSHLLVDFIEHMDYGREPMASMDIVQFLDDTAYLMGLKQAWSENDHRLFARLYAFIPVHEVTNPEPGFCWTWIST